MGTMIISPILLWVEVVMASTFTIITRPYLRCVQFHSLTDFSFLLFLYFHFACVHSNLT